MQRTTKTIVPTWLPPQDRIDFYREARYWRNASVTEELRRCVDRFPERTALRDSTSSLTFGELWERAATVASWLRARGLRPGEAVAFQLPNWTESDVIFHGVMMAGGVVVPMTSILRRREVGFILGQTGARFAFVAERFRNFNFVGMYNELLESDSHLESIVYVRAEREGSAIRLEDVESAAPLPREQVALSAGRGDDVAVVIYTSGTTADPKGAIHTHDGIMSSTRMCESFFSLNENDVLFNPSPVTHITGISLSFLFPATFGCTTTILEAWDPENAFDIVARERSTFLMFSTPFLAALTEIAEARDVRLADHIRTIVCGGADVPESLAERANDRLGEVVRMYGATEAPNTSCGSAWDPAAKKRRTEGRWLFPVEARVVDPHSGREVDPGEVGEAWWRAPQMCLGYVDESLNDTSYTLDGYFRTGDLVRVDDGGYVTVSGRIKEIINRGGEKFSAREIEEMIAGLPMVAEVAVTPMSDPVLGERVCAWVVLREGRGLTLSELSEHLLGYGLAKQKLPERLETIEELPRTPSGKVRKQVLRDRVDEALAFT
ncbi:AMP-binding protein [Aeromicrobium sp.]|uniref:class I adenylate-forming enzyme family protein n=1 Tax=Aeromicrobium sp. TaxID=1871063 RepID=UPI0019A9D5A6|nr:AMP-binding protein [Aeromicrobium sp.]MBC7630708.1 AMP-binding protein [Aeromicrobium sp.]